MAESTVDMTPLILEKANLEIEKFREELRTEQARRVEWYGLEMHREALRDHMMQQDRHMRRQDIHWQWQRWLGLAVAIIGGASVIISVWRLTGQS